MKKTIFFFGIILATIKADGMATSNHDRCSINEVTIYKKPLLKKSNSWSAENSSEKKKRKTNFRSIENTDGNMDIELRKMKKGKQNIIPLIHMLDEINKQLDVKIENIIPSIRILEEINKQLDIKIEKLDKQNEELRNNILYLRKKLDKEDKRDYSQQFYPKNSLQENFSTSHKYDMRDKQKSTEQDINSTYSSYKKPTRQQENIYFPNLSVIRQFMSKEGCENVISKF